MANTVLAPQSDSLGSRHNTSIGDAAAGVRLQQHARDDLRVMEAVGLTNEQHSLQEAVEVSMVADVVVL